MPPLHPAFVHFPVALVAFSFVTEPAANGKQRLDKITPAEDKGTTKP